MSVYNLNELFQSVGIIKGQNDGIVTIIGLEEVTNGEVISIHVGVDQVEKGLVLNMDISSISAIILTDDKNIKPGLYVSRDKTLMSIPAGEYLIGRTINPLGDFIDENETNEDIIWKNEATKVLVEERASSIISREAVTEPLETGIKIIDSLVPIGCGQRELIIGDAKTGKTSIAVDTILNQKEKDTICIYVAIGQKKSSTARTVDLLKKQKALDYTIVVVASASDPASLQYLAPYAGCGIGEYFMNLGLNVLIVYDDLSKHAVAYRQLSLLLRRPPGREGYPGDVFYLHSRLLERAANLKNAGSLTALPVIETIQGDVSAYIPTNVISITDGQIFLEMDLFMRGIRPAVSPGLSVSRVGSAAQNKVLKKMAGSLKLELAQYREVEDFTKLGFVLDDVTKRLVERGERLTKVLIQNRNEPIEMTDQTMFLYIVLNELVDDIDLSLINLFEREFYKFIKLTIFYEPLKGFLKEELDDDLIIFLITNFKEHFILNKEMYASHEG